MTDAKLKIELEKRIENVAARDLLGKILKRNPNDQLQSMNDVQYFKPEDHTSVIEDIQQTH